MQPHAYAPLRGLSHVQPDDMKYPSWHATPCRRPLRGLSHTQLGYISLVACNPMPTTSYDNCLSCVGCGFGNPPYHWSTPKIGDCQRLRSTPSKNRRQRFNGNGSPTKPFTMNQHQRPYTQSVSMEHANVPPTKITVGNGSTPTVHSPHQKTPATVQRQRSTHQNYRRQRFNANGPLTTPKNTGNRTAPTVHPQSH